MKLSAYARISTVTQEAGFGIAIQHDIMSKWARDNGHHITRFRDETESGGEGLDTRTGLANCIADIAEGLTKGIVVARLDRLARDLILQETIISELSRYGGSVFSCQAGEDAFLRDDDQDASRKLIRQILGAVAEYERAVIRLRMTAGRRLKQQRGGWGGGTTPYGWRSVKGALVPEPVEQEQIRLMRLWKDAGWAYNRIANTLNEVGVPTRRGGRWTAESVKRTLNHKVTRLRDVPGEGLRDEEVA